MAFLTGYRLRAQLLGVRAGLIGSVKETRKDVRPEAERRRTYVSKQTYVQ
jgi:hypothetical protein